MEIHTNGNIQQIDLYLHNLTPKQWEYAPKNYNKQKNYLLLYLLYLYIYTYLSYTYTILCLSPPQRPLYPYILCLSPPQRPPF